MRRIQGVSTLLVLVAAAAVAQDEKKPPRLPVDALGTAKRGDWAFYTVRFAPSRDGKALHPGTSHFRVVAGQGKKLTCWKSTEREASEATSAGDDAPRLGWVVDAVFPFRARQKSVVEIVATKDENRKLGDRTLACSMLSFKWTTGGVDREGTLWLSKDVKVLGVVGLELKSESFVQTYTLVGEGDAEKTTWGEAPARNAFGPAMGTCEIHAAGSPSPKLAGKSAKGEDFALDSSKGAVLVHFYSTWNDCQNEIEWLAALKKAYGPSGLTVVGVASFPKESLEDWKAYLEKNGAGDWTNVADSDGALGKEWGIGHAEIGEHATACSFYLVKKGKILSGDFTDAADLWTVRAMAGDMLRLSFNKVVPPDELKPTFGE